MAFKDYSDNEAVRSRGQDLVSTKGGKKGGGKLHTWTNTKETGGFLTLTWLTWLYEQKSVSMRLVFFYNGGRGMRFCCFSPAMPDGKRAIPGI